MSDVVNKFGQTLSKIQLLERQNRKHRRKIMFGYPQGKGTRPHMSPDGKPIWKPIKLKVPKWESKAKATETVPEETKVKNEGLLSRIKGFLTRNRR